MIPEIQDGKNVADFIDPDIVAKLDELEAEEERLEAAGFYDSESEADSDEEAIRTAASTIRDKKAMIRLKNAEKNKMQNRPIIPRKDQTRTLSDMTQKLKEAGYDASTVEDRALMLAKARGLLDRKRRADSDDDEMDEGALLLLDCVCYAMRGSRARATSLVDDATDCALATDAADFGSDAEEMDVDEGAQASKKRRTGTTSIVPRGKRVPTSNRATAGLAGPEQDSKAKRLRELYQRGPNMLAQASESDRRTPASLPRHLFSGKRKGGKTQRR